MNRIVLIGNGFDRAHELPTLYSHFINWYWREWGKYLLRGAGRVLEDNFCSFKLVKGVGIANWHDIWSFHYQLNRFFDPEIESKVLKIAQQDRSLCDYKIKSPFFEKICSEIDKPWFSIEDIYYTFLKSSKDPKQINDDLEFIKNKLVEYLNSLEKPSINSIIKKQILAPISQEDIAIGSKEKWKEMMNDRFRYDKSRWEHLIEGYEYNRENPYYSFRSVEYFKNTYGLDIINGEVDESVCPTFRLPDNIMLLDFNYTNTTDLYRPNADKFSVNHIHGKLSNPQSVIFGYGDEKDEEYKELMKKKDNEYLRHIKSFRYLDASNYRRMLAFIESDSYQICIMGHSCGVTDRTLLSTLFEHPNCVSIKPYYHQIDEKTDDYRKLVQNIARNFTDPRLMRDRVVGKERCEALGKE